MGKIIYLMGKSSTGKDTLFKRLLENPPCTLQTVVPYTTGGRILFYRRRGVSEIKKSWQAD